MLVLKIKDLFCAHALVHGQQNHVPESMFQDLFYIRYSNVSKSMQVSGAQLGFEIHGSDFLRMYNWVSRVKNHKV